MKSPQRELHELIYVILTTEASVVDLCPRVFDHVPGEAEFPYIKISVTDSSRRDASCILAAEHSAQVDVWSRAVGSGETYDIAAAVKRALHEANATLTENALAEMAVEAVRVAPDPDGQTTHGIITVRARIEER